MNLLRSILLSVAITIPGILLAQSRAFDKELANKIMTDSRLDTVEARALRLLTGFTAGTSYGEIWIRDFNTFIEGSLRVHSREEVKEKLLLFFKIQGKDGNIPDGAIHKDQANGGYQYLYSELAPGWAIHKNTVETDQESSLIQAVKKYIDITGDKSILTDTIGGRTVIQRMEDAMNYILKYRWSAKYNLVIGATTVDWGDVQTQKGWGVAVNDKTKWTIDIYDNAMFLLAIHDFLAMKPAGYKASRYWGDIAIGMKLRTRHYLWDKKARKYIPHIYLDSSPFPPSFNEKQILYLGGTICAVKAGLNTPKEIADINNQFLKAASKEKCATIGLTVYPPYPLEQFPNIPPYTYQNGGDWTWFGGRMIAPLIENDMVNEAYTELSPMIDRVLKNKGFFEWYDVRTGEAKGSGDFRGEAGVLYEAINRLCAWAKIHS
ncbi:hypothetical protein [Mucilaginibacter endophyticus]|uniref:hypothetical protein n=1 Tax=Mucilaginibacter endophyticus TaxID=2675003 RepID=UPI000E0CF237|nr:hypothetical protein [Mucilaginibacter endophyticus]